MKSLLGVGVILVVIALLTLGNLKAWGADWKYIEETYAGKFFYDADSIRPSKDIGRVWIKLVYTEKGVNYMVSFLGEKYRTLSYAILLFEYHCGDKKKCIVPVVCYSRDGKVLISADDQNPNWDFISPDSIDEALYKIICK
ncbi:MAG: surface-adhesin E family protein [Thermodesulfobacteriota bacterium]